MLTHQSPALDSLFPNGIPFGKLIEWGIPLGCDGRRIPILLLCNLQQPVLWILGDTQARVFAPAWAHLGMDLQRVFFMHSERPVQQLRPVFLEDLFKVIVIDSPQRLTKGELAFLTAQARARSYALFCIQPYFLTTRLGNPYATMRINCQQQSPSQWQVRCIKGKENRPIRVSLDESLRS